MILIFNDNHQSTLSFLSYLDKLNLKYLSLTIDNIIDDVIIKDEIGNNLKKCIWLFKKQKVDFSTITGLYNRIAFIGMDKFNDFIEEDRSYVQSEWWAYLIFRINDSNNPCNKITNEMISGLLYQFPFLYKEAQNIGFTVPKYHISTCYSSISQIFENNGRFIARNNLYNSNDFRLSQSLDKDSMALIEHVEGRPIFIHIIGEQLWGTVDIGINKKIFQGGDTIKYQSIALIKKLGLSIAELIFKLTDEGNLVLYNVSAFPNWLRSAQDNLDQIYNALALRLLNDNNTCR